MTDERTGTQEGVMGEAEMDDLLKRCNVEQHGPIGLWFFRPEITRLIDTARHYQERARIAEERLKRYGGHTPECLLKGGGYPGRCICGWEDARAALTTATPSAAEGVSE